MNIRNIWDRMSAIDDPVQEGHTCLVSIGHIRHKYLIHGLIDLLVTYLPLSLRLIQMIWYFWVEWVLNDYCWNSCLSLWYLASNQSVMDFRPHAMVVDFCYMDHRLMRLSYFFSSFVITGIFFFLLISLVLSIFLFLSRLESDGTKDEKKMVMMASSSCYLPCYFSPRVVIQYSFYVQKFCMPMIDDYVSFDSCLFCYSFSSSFFFFLLPSFAILGKEEVANWYWSKIEVGFTTL